MKKIYNKLVRNNFVKVFEHDVQNKISISDYSVRYMTPAETLEKLKDKLLEEVQEVFESYNKEDKAGLKEAAADVIEVIDVILYHHKISLEEVLSIRDAKRAQKGGFEKGVFLESMDYFDENK